MSDFGRACLVNAICKQQAGAMAIAPESGHVPLTPASDVRSAGLVFLFLRCYAEFEVGRKRKRYKDWILGLNRAYGDAAAAARQAARDLGPLTPRVVGQPRQPPAPRVSGGALQAREKTCAAPWNASSLLDMLPNPNFPAAAKSARSSRSTGATRRCERTSYSPRCWTCAGTGGRRARGSRASSAT